MTLEKFHVDCFVCFGQYSTMLKLLGRKLQSVNLRLKLQLLLNDSGVIFQPNDWKPEHITSKYSAALISYLLGKIVKVKIGYLFQNIVTAKWNKVNH